MATAELAAAIGIPAEAVVDIEQGIAVNEYGPGLAAAWTWAVGRHLDVPVDQDLATWQPAPVEPPASGERVPDDERGDVAPPPPPDPAGVDQPPGVDEPARTAEADAAPPAGREPLVAPGWLSDFDVDPLADFDPAAAGRPDDEDAAGVADEGGHAAPASLLFGDPDEVADAAGPPRDDGARGWEPPEDDLWGPGPGESWPSPESPPPGDEPVDEADASAATVDDAAIGDDAAPTAALAAPALDDAPSDDDTGELPSADDDTRVLTYTEGDDAPRLEPPSRLRRALVGVAGLVVLVAAGVGVGAVFAGFLDAPDDNATALGEQADDPTGQDADDGDDAPAEPTEPAEDDPPAADPDPDGAADGDGVATDGDGSDEDDAPDDEDTGAGTEGGVADGDADAAAAPGATTVQVLDGAGDNAAYSDAVATLQELGYLVIANGRAASDYDETLVLVNDGHADDAAALVDVDDRFANRAPNDRGLSEDVAMHVLVGRDWDPTGG